MGAAYFEWGVRPGFESPFAGFLAGGYGGAFHRDGRRFHLPEYHRAFGLSETPGKHARLNDGMENRIKEFRKEKGLTQEDLAQKVEVSRQTIISLERGRYDPSLFLAHKIAVTFGKKIEDVFIFEKEEEQ